MQDLVHPGIDFNPPWPLLHTYLATVSFPSDGSFMQDLIHPGIDFNPPQPLLHTYLATVSFPSDSSFMWDLVHPDFYFNHDSILPTAASFSSGHTFIPFPWQIFIPSAPLLHTLVCNFIPHSSYFTCNFIPSWGTSSFLPLGINFILSVQLFILEFIPAGFYFNSNFIHNVLHSCHLNKQNKYLLIIIVKRHFVIIVVINIWLGLVKFLLPPHHTVPEMLICSNCHKPWMILRWWWIWARESKHCAYCRQCSALQICFISKREQMDAGRDEGNTRNKFSANFRYESSVLASTVAAWVCRPVGSVSIW